MAQFLLVHGAWHGAWCWNRLISALAELGHEARGIDLPGGGGDTTPHHQVTLATCAGAVATALEECHGKVWLLGHSLGGSTVAQAVEIAPDRIAGAVYIAASMPIDGQSHLDALGSQEGSLAFEAMVIDPERGARIPPEHRAECFFNGCEPETVADALARLNAWQPLGPAIEPVRLTPERSGTVARYFVECTRDRAITLASQRRMQAASNLAGMASLDTCHSPFLSAPRDLAAALDGFVQGAA